MNIPDLTRIVDTYIRVTSPELDSYLGQLRNEVLPSIRKLQSDDLLGWFSFLVHGPDQLNGREPIDEEIYIHLRLEPRSGLDTDQFIAKLPPHFLKPKQLTFTNLGGVDSSVLKDENSAYAWKLHGEASEWVLFLIESHSDQPIPLHQIVQFLHFITNPLMLGKRCLCIPADYMAF